MNAASIFAHGAVANSATSATSSNVPCSIILRDIHGSFACSEVQSKVIRCSHLSINGRDITPGEDTEFLRRLYKQDYAIFKQERVLLAALKTALVPDIDIHCTDGTLIASSVILSARSPIFKTMFSGAYSENIAKSVTLPYKRAIVLPFIAYIQDASLPETDTFSLEDLVDLLVLIDMYQIDDGLGSIIRKAIINKARNSNSALELLIIPEIGALCGASRQVAYDTIFDIIITRASTGAILQYGDIPTDVKDGLLRHILEKSNIVEK